jgi:hypothetical protein
MKEITISGTCIHMKHKPSDPKCSCCPGGQHTFCRWIKIDGGRVDIVDTVSARIEKVLEHLPEGARVSVRIQIEV